MNEKEHVEIAQAIKQHHESLPALMEIFEMTAVAKFMRYKAFIKAGFSEDQAFALVKAELS